MKSFNPRHSLILASLLTLALLLSIMQPLPVLDDVRGRVIYAEDSNGAALSSPLQVNPAGLVEEPLAEPESGLQEDGEQPPASSEDTPTDDGADEGTEGAEPPDESTVGNEDSGTSTDTTGGSTGSETTEGSTEGGTTEATLPPTVTEESQTIASETVPDEASPAFAPLQAEPPEDPRPYVSFDAYYIQYDSALASEKGPYQLSLIGDKTPTAQSVKYQLEFHNDIPLAEGDVEIKMPYSLYTDRQGQAVTPAAIGVPQAPYKSQVSPFNYSISDDGQFLVFSNARPISAGRNNLVQVRYQLNDMQTLDGRTWTLTPEVKVRGRDLSELTPPKTLNGSMDTEVELRAVEKRAYSDNHQYRYYPELYSWNHVLGVLHKTAEECPKPSDFDDYKYLLWQTRVELSASQPWSLTVTDTPELGGEVVGYVRYNENPQLDRGYIDTKLEATYTLNEQSSYGLSSQNANGYIYTVVRYPKNNIPTDSTTIPNTIKVTVTGLDDKEERTLESTSKRIWQDYQWNNYVGKKFAVEKTYDSREDDTEVGYTSVLREKMAAGMDMELPRPWHMKASYLKGHKEDVSQDEYTAILVDDLLYVKSNLEEYKLLGPEDYYYSQIQFSLDEHDINLYGDETWPVSDGEPVTIQVQTADQPDVWQEVAKVPFTEISSYQIPDPWPGLGIYRIRVEHKSSRYELKLHISAKTVLRATSPTLKAMLDDTNVDTLTLLNLDGGYYRGPDGKDHFPERHDGELLPGVDDFDKQVYGGPLYRAKATVTLNSVTGRNTMQKFVKTSQDTIHGRVNMDYVLLASEGYDIYSLGVDYLKSLDLSVGRQQVYFYDLLPLGMKFNPQVPVTVGSPDMFTPSKANPDSWNQEQYSVDWKVVDNYKGSGRQLLRFCLNYSGEDGSRISSGPVSREWYQSWGLRFGAFYSWNDYSTANEASNVAAFNTIKKMIGKSFPDDGTGLPAGTATDPELLKDVDGNGEISGFGHLIYATAVHSDDLTLAAQSGIEKFVKADADSFMVPQKEASVEVGKGYTYTLQVRVIQNGGKAKDIVIFDHLEDGETTSWKGSFDGLDLSELKLKGINPKVYYSASESASHGDRTSSGDWTPGTDWTPSDQWTQELSAVKSLAIDISQDKDGQEFILQNGQSISCGVHMKAPEQLQEAKYAFNRASFSSKQAARNENFGVSREVTSASTKVSLFASSKLSIEKKLAEDTPAIVKDESFAFSVSLKGSPLADKEYELWAGKDKLPGIHATDADGQLFLKAGQTARFPSLPAGAEYKVTELTGGQWSSDHGKTRSGKLEGNQESSVCFTNTYQPTLYFEKRLKYAQDYTNSGDKFSFVLKLNGLPAGGREYYLFTAEEAEKQDTALPPVIDDKPAQKTDESGGFQLTAGQRAAFILPPQSDYSVKEIDIPEDYNQEVQRTVTGHLEMENVFAFLSNEYLYKDLFVKKTVQCAEGVVLPDETFTFELKLNDQPAAGVEYILYGPDSEKAGQMKEIERDKHLPDNGQFTLKDGQEIRLIKLPKGASYEVSELLTDEQQKNYRMSSENASGKLPLYAPFAKASFNNQYLIKNLEVSKTVIAPTDKDKSQVFTFVVTKNGEAMANTPYRLFGGETEVLDGSPFSTDGEGKFTLKHGQRAFLPGFREGDSYTVREEKADGYTQIAPKDSEGFSGTVDPSMQNTKVAFRNLNKDNSDVLIFSKHIELDEPLSQRIYGDGKIKQKDFDISEIEKKDLDNLAKVEFTFQILVNEKPSESTTYTLIDANGKEYPEKKTSEIENKPGCFTLKADEMAIFKVPDKGHYEIKELLPEDDNDHYYYFIRAKSQSNEWYKIYGHWEVKEAPEAKAVSGDISDTGVTQTVLTNLLKYDDFANARYLELYKNVNGEHISENASWPPAKKESEKLKHVPLRFHATFFDKEGQEVKVDKGLKWYKNKISFDKGIPSPPPTPLAVSNEDGYIEVNFTQGDHGAIYLYYSDEYTVKLEEALPPGHPAGELIATSIAEYDRGSRQDGNFYTEYTFYNVTHRWNIKVEKQVLNDEDADKSFTFKIERRQLTSVWNFQTRVSEKKIVYLPYAHASFMRYRAGFTLDPVTGQPETTDEQGRFTLHAGELAYFQVPSLPGTANYYDKLIYQPRFRVTEETYSDYASQITVEEDYGQTIFNGNCAELKAGKKVIFTNTHEETAGLSVSKTVTREEGQIAPIPDQSFRFKLAVNGQPWKNKNYRLYDPSGKEVENKRKVENEKVKKGVDEIKPWTTDNLGRFSLKDGERAVFDWIGAGKNYEITELPAEGFVQTVPAEGHSLSGVISQKGEVLSFTNMFKNPERKGELIVRKQLQLPAGISDYPEESFDFKVEIGGKPFNSWSYDLYSEDGSRLEEKQTDSEGKFSLKGKQYAVLKNVPPNQDYKVSEVPKEDSLYQVLSQNPQEGATTDASTDLCFVNGLSSLWVRKEVTNHSLQKPDPNEDFSFNLTLDGQAPGEQTYWLYDKDLKKLGVKSCAADGSFTLKADESAIFFGIPADKAYTLKERPKEKFSQTLPADPEGYSGKIDYSAKKLIFVNNYAPLPGLWLSKHVIDKDNHPVADIRSFSFKLSREGQPLAGKNYRLYATDGSPKPELYQTNKEGVLQLRSGERAYFEGLEAGDYKAEELEVPKAYTPVEREMSKPLNREGGDVRFDFVNKIPETIYGNLVITNTVRPSGDKQSFHYILKLSDPGIQGLQGTLYEGGLKGSGILPDAANAKALGQLAFDDGKAEFSPSNNQRLELQGLQGTRYRASQEGARLLPAKANAEALGQLSFVDGKAEFDLSDNQWVHLKGLLAGTDYEVQEIENEDYRTTVQGQPGFSWKGSIVANETAQVDYVNERVTPPSPEDDPFTPHIVKPCCPAPQTISQTTAVPGKRLYRLPRTGEGTNPAWGSLFGALLLLLGLSAIRRRH